ncbi:MAG: glycosyltransferase family 2 protein [Kiritimatiellae bacterium]|jgi:undecaprenyl-phosphate 4-deoxy-4-formamido-L-arabinose transferase|nr:glycosyltransferase family 2 protein [Kiritimatiellia bacterium]MDD4340630.1 glycosyltransferase family 2 protein [Kiritimatiellia bacterium]MDY0148925.1 glycosyltransferase family 2 protein [Kiritimatiellia bacterium]
MNAPLESGLSIVVPVYRAEATLRPLVDRIEQALAEFPHPFELLLVNDNSPDGSAAIIDTLATETPWIRGVHFMRNYGQHNAILAGVRQARFNRLVTMDDDLQHPPEAIPALLHKLDEGFDVVYAPPLKEYHGALRDAASRMTKTLLKHALGITVARDVASFRAFRTDLREAFADYHNPAVFIDVLLTWATTSFTAVPVQHETDSGGASTYTFGKLLLHALNMVTSFSTLPLRIASLLGVGTVLFGTALLVYIVIEWLLGGNPVRGFTMLFSMIVIFSGVQLLSLGILGEYLARMYQRSMGRPPYVIKPSPQSQT